MAKITKRIVDEAKPGTNDLFIRDDDLRGFGLKVTPKGARVYFLEWQLPGGRGSPKGRIVIGRHGSPWTPDTARRHAYRLLESVRKGVNPIAAKREAHRVSTDLAFDAYAASFIENYAKRQGLRSIYQMESGFKLHCVPQWGAKPLSSITRKDVNAVLSKLAENKPARARYVHAVLRKLFRWAVGRGDLEASPMTDMPPPAPAMSRDRVLTDEELVALWRATGKIPFKDAGSAVRLLILTGQRRSEVLGMDYSELDMATATCTWTIPVSRSKNGKAHIVPLSSRAMTELAALGANDRRRGLVFTTTGSTPISGVSKMKKGLDKAMLSVLKADDPEASFTPWRLHDIRRTVATGLQRLGIRFEVTEAVLNHVSGSKSGVAGVYQRHDWAAEKRAALEAWAAHIDILVSGTLTQINVVELKRA